MLRVSLISLFVLLAGCGQLPQEPAPQVVMAVFDPSRSEIPSPNDLAMVDGKVAIAPGEAAPAADNELKALLNGKDGFSTGSTTKVRFSAPMSAASFSADSIVALDLGRVGEQTPPSVVEVSFEYASCDRSLTVSSATGFQSGHRYLFAVRGGAGDKAVKGEGGEQVVPSPVFYFLRAGKDLREHASAFPGTREEKAATAEKLEAVRQRMEPLFGVLEANGLPRRDVAILWTFTALKGAEAAFDPASKRLPMPNDLLRDPATGRVSLPISPTDNETQQHLKRGFNQLDGFSTTGALTLDFTQPINRDSVVVGDTVRVFRRDTLEEKTGFGIRMTDDAQRLFVEPKSPLLPATSYVVVLAGVRDAQENLVGAMPLANLLKLQSPLVDGEGRTQIPSLCDEQAARLEPLRAAMQPVLDHLAPSIPRARIAAAWTFTTQDILERVDELFRTPYEKDLPLVVKEVDNRSPAQRFLTTWNSCNPPKVSSDVARVITGKMVTWDRLDPVTRAFRENGEGVQRDVEFILTLPTGLTQGQKVPVVVFGHGLMTERRLAIFLSERLADKGFAVMAIDFPMHGERTACLQDNHCESGATCAADGRCVKNGQPADLARVSVPSGWGKGIPTATGQAFVDVENLFAARDHFRQAFIDVSAQVRLIRNMDWTAATGGFHLDGDKIFYAGISLGGIMGASLSAVDPSFRAMLLNVPGADLPVLMEESAFFGPQLEQGLGEKGITRGSPAYYAFVNAARWVLDEVDPVNLAVYGSHAPRAYADPVTGAPGTMAKKRLRIQMANGDAIVPNSSTQRLLTVSRLDKDTEFRAFTGSHGFLANPSETAACYAGQQDMVEFIEGKK
jgi:pimeloyl-ACP methyl ester carboxylesterase